MRHWIASAFVVLISSSSLALAAAPAAPAPATAAPATPAKAANRLDAPSRVLVAPFTEVNPQQQQPDWINRAIQQSVQDELAALSGVEVVPSDPGNAPPATAQAKAAGVQYIVRGTIQRLNGDIRVTGRIETADGRTIGGFKATDAQERLFAIEDSIAQQIKRTVAPMEADPSLEDARPIANGPRRGPTTLQPPVQPVRGGFEGSDLQRALDDRDYLRRTQRRVPNDYAPPPMYYPPQQTYYPPTYPWGFGGYGYGYGYGYDWGGDTNIVIIKGGNGDNGNGGNGGGGSVVTPTIPRVPIQTIQTQRLRNAAVHPGNSGNFIGPAPHRAPAPGTKKQ